MRSISIRQFQQHFHAELTNIPFCVTRRGKQVFQVCSPPMTLKEMEKDWKKQNPCILVNTNKPPIKERPLTIRTTEEAERIIRARGIFIPGVFSKSTQTKGGMRT